MMSSSPDTMTRTTGAHRARRETRDRAAARTLVQRPPARYEPYVDGLFTYCLSVLCDHDAATAALGGVLALAERRAQRAPQAAGDRRAWLYALARWACLCKLAEAKQKRQAAHAAGRSATERERGTRPGTPPGTPPVSEQEQERRRRELALLAWPEAAGTTPEQREALELAVRHQLAAHEVAAVLGMDLAAARDLLASAACEVERTRAALAVVETGGCPSVARLTGDHRLVLSTALRRELVRHVDDCPRCRRTAERALPGQWPGADPTPAQLPVLEAPRAALHMAMAHHPRARATAPRFDRRGFPMGPKDRAARRARLRARAVTTTVVATVVAAPVLALWSAYRGGPGDEGGDGRGATAGRDDGPGVLDGERASGGYENAGNAGSGARFSMGNRPDVSVEVISVAGAGRTGPGRLRVAADNSGDTTLITLTASGSAPVRWSASTSASWLYLSRSSGTLRPGQTLTIKVYVDQLREPSGYWSARVAVSPAAIVSIQGYGSAAAPSDPGPGPAPDPRPSTPVDPGQPPSPGPDPSPTTPAPPDPTPSGPATPPGPEPTPSASNPSAPESPVPPPGDDGGAPNPGTP
ncbi:BACON domain-containing protein [Streptomyces cinereospinus]|uniref:BACON domain-containing protein n=1 Tax=Streptomyces cinereospinus TaxID=285561 RepID=A0ABV5N9M5_9ACTN